MFNRQTDWPAFLHMLVGGFSRVVLLGAVMMAIRALVEFAWQNPVALIVYAVIGVLVWIPYRLARVDAEHEA